MSVVGLNFGSATSGTGFDVTSTVASIVGNLKLIENPWNTQLAALKADDTALTSIGTDLASLSTSLNALTDFNGVLAQKLGSSSNTNLLTLSSANATATSGNHTVVVGQLAQTASNYSDPIAAADSISGALTIQVGGGTATTIPVIPGVSDTLATYAAAINYANAGVTASVISDVSGSRLSLVSKTSGSAGALTITQGGTTSLSTAPVGSASSVAPTSVRAASNTFTLPSSSSELSGTFSYAVGSGSPATVNLGSTPLSLAASAAALNADTGFASAGLTATVSGANLVITGSTDASGAATLNTSSSTLTSTTPAVTYGSLADVTTPGAVAIHTSLLAQNAQLTVDGVSVVTGSNTVSTAIPGVTFQLLAQSATPVQIAISNDNAGVENALSTFVSAYNTVLGDLKTQEGKTATGAAEPLFGNPFISQLQSALSLALTTGTASGSIKSLDQLGITVTNTGSLTLNNSTLDSTLNSHFSDVVGFLQNTGSFGQTLLTSLDGLGSQSPQGAITLALAADTTLESTLNHNITAQDSLIATDQTRITAQLTLANEILQSIPQQLNAVNELYSALTGYNTKQG